jgi:hypothetical protein
MAKLLVSNPLCCGLWEYRCSSAGATPMCTQRGGRMVFTPFDVPLQRVSCDPGATDLRASTHPRVVKIVYNVVMLRKPRHLNIHIHQRMCNLEKATRHPVLVISHIFEGSHCTSSTPPSLCHLSSRLQVLPHGSGKIPSTTYSVTQEQNVYNHDLVSSIGGGEEGRRIS